MPHALIWGNPAKQHGWVNEKGEKLISLGDMIWSDREGEIWMENNNGITKK